MTAAATMGELGSNEKEVWQLGTAVFYRGGLGSDIWLVDGQPAVVPRPRSQVAMVCGGSPATLEQHVVRVTRALPAMEGNEVRESIRWLADCGILQSAGQLRESLRPVARDGAGQDPEPRRIQTLGIVSASRPHALRRCAESYLAHFHQCGRNEVRCIIADDSRTPDDLAANSRLRDELGANNRQAQVVHLSSREKIRLRREWIRQGIPHDAAEFALPVAGEPYCGPGANRNWLLALTAGEKILSVDDDTVCQLWRHPDASQALRLNGHEDPCEYWFPANRSSTNLVPAGSDANLLAAHEQLLGRSVGDLARTALILETRDTCPHLLPARGELTANVAVTYGGLSGDCGMFSALRFLLCKGETRARLAADQSLYARAMENREIVRIAPSPTVTHNQVCMTTTLGIDNQRILPPFPPGWRAEDKVFGCTLAILFPHSVSADIPLGIEHNADRPGPYALSIYDAAPISRVCDLLCALLTSMTPPDALLPSEARWRAVSEYLRAASQCSPRAFGDLLQRCWIEARLQTVRLIERRQAEFAYPAFWMADMQRYCRTVMDSLPYFLHQGPMEFREQGCSAGEAFAQLQRVCHGMAGMFACWENICSAAREFGLERVRTTRRN